MTSPSTVAQGQRSALHLGCAVPAHEEKATSWRSGTRGYGTAAPG